MNDLYKLNIDFADDDLEFLAKLNQTHSGNLIFINNNTRYENVGIIGSRENIREYMRTEYFGENAQDLYAEEIESWMDALVKIN